MAPLASGSVVGSSVCTRRPTGVTPSTADPGSEFVIALPEQPVPAAAQRPAGEDAQASALTIPV